jgi:hypothetical protein
MIDVSSVVLWGMKNWMWGVLGIFALCLSFAIVGYMGAGAGCDQNEIAGGCSAAPRFGGFMALALVFLLTGILSMIRANRVQHLPLESAAPFGKIPEPN